MNKMQAIQTSLHVRTNYDAASQSSSSFSFMKALLSKEEDTSDSSINSLRAAQQQRPRSKLSSFEKAQPQQAFASEPEELDVIVLLSNEKNEDKIEMMTENKYDLYDFHSTGIVQKWPLATSKVYHLDINHDDVDYEERKFDYNIRRKKSAFVDPFDQLDDETRLKKQFKTRRSKSLTYRKTVFKCVQNRSRPKDTLKNADRTRSISQQLKQSEMNNQYDEKRKVLTRDELIKSVARLSRMPKKKKEPKLKTLHDGIVLTDTEIKEISLRLYNSRSIKYEKHHFLGKDCCIMYKFLLGIFLDF